MTITEQLIARRLYDLECAQPNRTFASDHSFEEWMEAVYCRRSVEEEV